MGRIADAFRNAWRDFTTEGNPSSKVWMPRKGDIRPIGPLIEEVIGENINEVVTAERQDREAADASLSDRVGVVENVAYTNANVFETIAAGISATTSGQQFQVGGSDEITRYRNDSGVAVPIASFPSSRRVTAGYEADQNFHSDQRWDERFQFLDLATQTVTNLSDGATLAHTRTKVADGLRIALTTGSRIGVFSTANKVGSGLTRISYHAETTFTTTCTVGLSITDDVDRWTIEVSQNGWVVYSNTRGGTGALTNAMGAWTSGATVDIDFVIDGDAGTAQIRVSVNGAAPWSFGVSNICTGGIQLVQRGPSTVIHRMGLEVFGGLERDEIARVEAQRSDGVRSAAGKLLSLFERHPPSGWQRDLPDDAHVYTYQGGYFHGIDLQPILSELDPTVQVYHVDIATGADTNLGTETAPLKSLRVAAARIGVGSRCIIKAKGGLYPYEQAFGGGLAGAVIQIVSWDGVPVVSSRHYTGLTWVEDTGTTFTTTLPAPVSGVVDTTNLTADGDYTPLTPVTTAALCRSTPGSWFFSSSTLYVNTIDGREPDDDIRAYRTSSNTSDQYGINMVADGQVLYMQDLHLEGGTLPFRVTSSNSAYSMTSYARRCHVKYGSGTGDQASGNGLHIRQECVSAQNGNDGWNWQPSGFGGDPCLALELNCIGRGNGWNLVNLGTSNGSSSHGADVIRVNGVYYGNRDRNVHDIAQGRASRSWNLGCKARDSQTGNSNWANGINADDASIMWLDGCTSSGGPIDIEVTASAVVYTHDFEGAGANAVAGTIAAYEP